MTEDPKPPPPKPEEPPRRTGWRSTFDHTIIKGDTEEGITRTGNVLRDQSNADAEWLITNGSQVMIIPRIVMWTRDRWAIERSIKAAYDDLCARTEKVESQG